MARFIRVQACGAPYGFFPLPQREWFVKVNDILHDPSYFFEGACFKPPDREYKVGAPRLHLNWSRHNAMLRVFLATTANYYMLVTPEEFITLLTVLGTTEHVPCWPPVHGQQAGVVIAVNLHVKLETAKGMKIVSPKE